MDENTIDLIVTSPPYNIDIKYNSYEDSLPYEVYILNLLKSGSTKLIIY